MNLQTNKQLRVFLAISVGALLVFVALNSSRDSREKATLTAGPADISITAPLSSNSTASKKLFYNNQVASEELATTTTSLLSLNLLTQYTAIQEQTGGAALNDSQVALIADDLVQGLKLPQGKQYALSDLNTSNDNSATALSSYESAVTKILTSSSKTKSVNELVIFMNALQKNDLSGLSAITPILSNYDVLIKGLLAVKTPSVVAPLHLRLVQAYSNIRNLSAIMQGVSADPVGGFVAVREYKKELTVLETLGKEYLSISIKQ